MEQHLQKIFKCQPWIYIQTSCPSSIKARKTVLSLHNLREFCTFEPLWRSLWENGLYLTKKWLGKLQEDDWRWAFRVLFAGLRLKWRKKQGWESKNHPRNRNWKLLKGVFCLRVGPFEAAAEMEFGVQDVYEGWMPVEGRGRRRMGRRAESQLPVGLQSLAALQGASECSRPSELSSLGLLHPVSISHWVWAALWRACVWVGGRGRSRRSWRLSVYPQHISMPTYTFSFLEDCGQSDNLERWISSHCHRPLFFCGFPESFEHPLHIWVALCIVNPDFPQRIHSNTPKHKKPSHCITRLSCC